jgi:hypothetical protein
MVFSVRAQVQVVGIGGDVAVLVAGNNHFDGRIAFGPGFYAFYNHGSDVLGVEHGLGEASVQVYLHISLSVMDGGEDKALFAGGIFL